MHQGPYREHVMRAGLVLQALTYWPTGAVMAAATTSLPGCVGFLERAGQRVAWRGRWNVIMLSVERRAAEGAAR
jgi:GH15 family glucan-1,4-alpha-glucosidase